MCDVTTCILAGKCAPRVVPGTDPRYSVICVCDPGADQLAALMETSGVDQWTASHLLWSPEVLAERNDEREAG